MKTLSRTLGLLLAALAAAGAQAADKELLIGVNDSLTGPGAVYGLPQSNSVQMAAEEINAAGGIKAGADVYKIKVIANDDKANPTEATNSVRKLIDRDGAKYLLGFCCSGPTSAVASFIERENALMLVGNAAERAITAKGLPNLFRTRPPADFTGAAAGVFVGKRGGRPSSRQSDIHRLMIEFARQGKKVVRLKGGDPTVFGRAGEEIEACRNAGLRVEIIPGVTAALGAAASLCHSLTHRDLARRLQFVTAYSKDGGVPDDLDWRALADPSPRRPSIWARASSRRLLRASRLRGWIRRPPSF